MMDISDRFKEGIVIVRAGPGGESDDDIFRYVSSPLPAWVKSVDEPFYRIITTTLLQAAKEMVQETGQDITFKLTYSVRVNQ